MRLFLSALFVGLAAVGYMAVGSPQIASPPTAGILAGVVVDDTGAVVAGATVDLRVGTRVDRTTVTDAGGRSRFEKVIGGSYELRAFMAGFLSVSMKIVVVNDRPIPAVRLALARPSPNAAPAEKDPASVRPMSAPAAPSMLDSAMAKSAVGGIVGGLPYEQMRTLAVGPRLQHRGLRPIDDNRFRRVTDDPLSTFSIDVDTASYTNVRRFLNAGHAAAGRRGAHRGAGQLLPLRLPRAAAATRRSR